MTFAVIVRTGDTNSTTTVTNVTNTDLLKGHSVTGTGIPAGAYITNISGTTITISAAATATATGVSLTFGLIIQTGTDTSLTGLTGIFGVTKTTSTGRYTLNEYNLSNVMLSVRGTLTMSSTEKLIFSNTRAPASATASVLDINGGTFSLFEDYTRNSYTDALPIEAIVFSLTGTADDYDSRIWRVVNAGKMRAKRAIFRCPHSIWFEPNASGWVYLSDCVIDKRGATAIADCQNNIQATSAGVAGSAGVVLERCKIYADGMTGLTFRTGGAPVIDNVQILQARDAWNNEIAAYRPVRGLTPLVGNTVDVSQWNGIQQTIINALNGTQFIWGGHQTGTNAAHTGRLSVWQEFSANVKDATGAAISGAKLFIQDQIANMDTALTTCYTNTGATINPALQQTYRQTSDGSGNVASFGVLTGTGIRLTSGLQIAGGNSNRVRPRGKNSTVSDSTDDLFDVGVLNYGHFTSVIPVAMKAGSSLSSISQQFALAVDANVTLSLASAQALATISTLDNLYDAGKAWKIANGNETYPTLATQPVTANGTTVDIGALNIVIDGTAASAFAINTGTSTLTINSTVLAAGTKFKFLKTTGTLSLANGGTITAGYTDSTGVNVPTTITGLVAGSRIQIYNVTDSAQVLNATVAGTSYFNLGLYTADKVYRLRIAAIGYLPYETTGNYTSAGISFIASQVVDSVYVANGINGASVTEFSADYPNVQVDINDPDGLGYVQRLYAWFRYNETTSSGIAAFLNGLIAFDSFNYQIQVSLVNLLLDNVGTLNVIFSDAYLSRSDGSSPVYSLTSKSIILSPGRAYSSPGTGGFTNSDRAILKATQVAALAGL